MIRASFWFRSHRLVRNRASTSSELHLYISTTIARSAPTHLPRYVRAVRLCHSTAYSRVGLEFQGTLAPKGHVALRHLLTWISRRCFCQHTALLPPSGRPCSLNAESLQKPYIR